MAQTVYAPIGGTMDANERVDARHHESFVAMIKLRMLESVPMFTSAEAGTRVLGGWNYELGTRTIDELVTFNGNGSLIEIRFGNTKLYPAFQFDPLTGRLIGVVERVNQLLRSAGDPWGVLGWWTQPNAWISGDRSPSELLASEQEVLVPLAKGVLSCTG